MYKLTEGTEIVRLSDGAIIPTDSADQKYAEYIEWRAAGNMPEPAHVPSAAEIKLQEIVAIEQANPITHRALRELILAIGSVYPQAQGAVFYQKALAADTAVQVIKDRP